MQCTRLSFNDNFVKSILIVLKYISGLWQAQETGSFKVSSKQEQNQK